MPPKKIKARRFTSGLNASTLAFEQGPAVYRVGSGLAGRRRLILLLEVPGFRISSTGRSDATFDMVVLRSCCSPREPGDCPVFARKGHGWTVSLVALAAEIGTVRLPKKTPKQGPARHFRTCAPADWPPLSAGLKPVMGGRRIPVSSWRFVCFPLGRPSAAKKRAQGDQIALAFGVRAVRQSHDRDSCVGWLAFPRRATDPKILRNRRAQLSNRGCGNANSPDNLPFDQLVTGVCSTYSSFKWDGTVAQPGFPERIPGRTGGGTGQRWSSYHGNKKGREKRRNRRGQRPGGQACSWGSPFSSLIGPVFPVITHP